MLTDEEQVLLTRPTALDVAIQWADGAAGIIARAVPCDGMPSHVIPRLQALAVRLDRFRKEVDVLQTEIIEAVTKQRVRDKNDTERRLRQVFRDHEELRRDVTRAFNPTVTP